MSSSASYDVIPQVAVETPSSRKNLLLLATSLVSAAVFMGYIALLGHYVSERAAVLLSGEIWLPEGVVIPLTQPNYMGVTITFSFVTVWWAVSAVRNEDKANAFVAYGLTLLFGFAYLAQTAYLLSIMELEAAGGERAVLIYSLVGTHMAVAIVAIGSVAVAMLRTLSGDYSSKNYEGVTSSAIFWTVMAVLYSVLWYALYITK